MTTGAWQGANLRHRSSQSSVTYTTANGYLHNCRAQFWLQSGYSAWLQSAMCVSDQPGMVLDSAGASELNPRKLFITSLMLQPLDHQPYSMTRQPDKCVSNYPQAVWRTWPGRRRCIQWMLAASGPSLQTSPQHSCHHTSTSDRWSRHTRPRCSDLHDNNLNYNNNSNNNNNNLK